jgi:hypothetical protein
MLVIRRHPGKTIALFAAITLIFSFTPQFTCPPTGLTRKGKVPKRELAELNQLKNRTTQPTAKQINKRITLETLFNSLDSKAAFNENEAVTIEGYLVDAKDEKGESCNCYSIQNEDHDIHVFISPDKNVADKKKKDCLVVELSPYSKKLLPEWTTSYIKRNKGKKVRITGWLMFDIEHLNVSVASRPYAAELHRHNAWEVHPITDIRFVK